MKNLLKIGSLFAALAVLLGAFAAHALKPLLNDVQIHNYETGLHYHFIHSLGIILIAILFHQFKLRQFYIAGLLMALGIIFFSFSLYLLSLRDVLGIQTWTFLGPITPIGGSLMIIAWIMVFIAAFKIKND